MPGFHPAKAQPAAYAAELGRLNAASPRGTALKARSTLGGQPANRFLSEEHQASNIPCEGNALVASTSSCHWPMVIDPEPLARDCVTASIWDLALCRGDRQPQNKAGALTTGSQFEFSTKFACKPLGKC